MDSVLKTQIKKRHRNETGSQKCTTCHLLSFRPKTPLTPTSGAQPRSVTRIQGYCIDTFLCSKCRNSYYRAIKIYISKIIDNFEESKFSQDSLNNFTFSYLNNKHNCKKRKNLVDLYTFEVVGYLKASFGGVFDEAQSFMLEEADGESETVCDCGFCGFRIMFFVFKMPDLELFAGEKVFKHLFLRFWPGMLCFLKMKVPNVGVCFDVMITYGSKPHGTVRRIKSEIKVEFPDSDSSDTKTVVPISDIGLAVSPGLAPHKADPATRQVRPQCRPTFSDNFS